MKQVVLCQLLLRLYHQATTLLDLHPFNGAWHYTVRERVAEAGINAFLMSLAPIGFAFRIHGLMLFGVIYYFVPL
jgi:hypothetical protein